MDKICSTGLWLRHYTSKNGHQLFVRVRIGNVFETEIPVYDYINEKRYVISISRDHWNKGTVTGGDYHRSVDEINNIIKEIENDVRNSVSTLAEKKFQITRSNILRLTYCDKENKRRELIRRRQRQYTGLLRGNGYPQQGGLQATSQQEVIKSDSSALHIAMPVREEKFITDLWNDFIKNRGTKAYAGTLGSIREYSDRTGDNCRASDFSAEWLERYFKDIIENGYSQRKDGSGRKYYTIPTILKYLKHLRAFGNYLFKDLKLLDSQDYLRFDLAEPGRRTPVISYRHEPFINAHALTKREYDWFYGFRFADKQKELARDMFILQTWLGGLSTTEFSKINNIKLINYPGSKPGFLYDPPGGKKSVLGEINRYYIIPVLERYPDGFSIYLSPPKYNMLLKSAAKAAGLNGRIKIARELINDDKAFRKEYPVHERISSGWARYCAVSILVETGLPDELVLRFTGMKNLALIQHFRKVFPGTAITAARIVKPEPVSGVKPIKSSRAFRSRKQGSR